MNCLLWKVPQLFIAAFESCAHQMLFLQVGCQADGHQLNQHSSSSDVFNGGLAPAFQDFVCLIHYSFDYYFQFVIGSEMPLNPEQS